MSLQDSLRPLPSQRAIGFAPNFATYQNMADRSRSLTLEPLRQLTGLLLTGNALTSLGYNNLLPPGTTGISLQSLVFSRTQPNVRDVCINARLYRQNRRDFKQLTNNVPSSNPEEWTCNSCNMVVSRVSLRLSPPSPDLIWISASGMLEAHCTRKPGRSDGWTCIWPVVSLDCYVRFDGEKQLLQHMRTYHVKLGTQGQDSKVHWPANIRRWRFDTCGFGATIGGRGMQESESCFVIPGSAS